MAQSGPQNHPQSSPDASERPPRTSLWPIRRPMRRRGGPQRADPSLLHEKTTNSWFFFAHPLAPRPRPQLPTKDHLLDMSLIRTHTHAPRVGGFKRPAATCADPERALAPQLPRRDQARRSPNRERVHRARTSLRRPCVIGLFQFSALVRIS